MTSRPAWRASCDGPSKPCSARPGWTPISPRRSSCWDQAGRPHLTALTREARQRRPDRRSAGTDPEWIDAARSADSKLRTALGQVGVELIGLVSVLVDLVLLEHPPPHPTPDHIAVLVHDLAVGPVQMIAPTDADRRVPRHALGHHLVCADLDPRCGEAAQPALDLPPWERIPRSISKRPCVWPVSLKTRKWRAKSRPGGDGCRCQRVDLRGQLGSGSPEGLEELAGSRTCGWGTRRLLLDRAAGLLADRDPSLSFCCSNRGRACGVDRRSVAHA